MKNYFELFYKFIFLMLHLLFFRYLPASSTYIVGPFFKMLRYYCCKPIFKYCGKNVNIERKAFFGSGKNLIIGHNSGLGINCVVPSDTVIGNNVMMGPNVYILSSNHQFSNFNIPIIDQGMAIRKKCLIEDDVWIGRQVIFTPGRIIKKGTIIGAGSVVTKDFLPFSIIGGNPARLIRNRTQ